jgi:fumarate hydratase class I
MLFIAKGGGSANKAFLFQATPSILTHDRMVAFLKEKVLTLGTAACPPVSPGDRDRRHLGRADDEDGQARLDQISRQPADAGQRDGHAFRDLAMEQEV